MSELQKQYEEMIEKQQKLRKEFQVLGQELFKGITKEFFDKNPGITAIVWTQYCDYFNDGEPCTFAVHDPVYTNAPEDELDNVNQYGEYEGETEGIWATEGIGWIMQNPRDYNADIRNAILAGPPVDVASCEFFSKMITSGEMEDIMASMFGSDSRIVATRDGFDSQDYCDHN